jgi:uncharacterized protein YbjT (DUF2867 family)
VLVTGATGFTGEHVIAAWPRDRWPNVSAFARPSSDTARLRDAGVDVRIGTLEDLASFRQALDGIDTLINVTSLGFGHAPDIVRLARDSGVRRAVFVSTTALFTTLPARTRAVRVEAEECVRASTLRWTILRPTMIYGTPRDRNIWRLIQFVRRSPIVPVVGRGHRLQQPVHVEDVAAAIWASLAHAATERRAFDIAGAAPVRFVDLVHAVAGALGRRVVAVPVPLSAMIALARVARGVPGMPRLTDEQILRLAEDKVFPTEPARVAFGYNPRSFEDGVRQEVAWLGNGRD